MSFFQVTCPEALITNFMVRKWNINKKWFLHFAIKHNRDVSNALTIRFIDSPPSTSFPVRHVDRKWKMWLYFSCSFNFFSSHFPSTEWIYWCYEFYVFALVDGELNEWMVWNGNRKYNNHLLCKNEKKSIIPNEDKIEKGYYDNIPHKCVCWLHSVSVLQW